MYWHCNVTGTVTGTDTGTGTGIGTRTGTGTGTVQYVTYYYRFGNYLLIFILADCCLDCLVCLSDRWFYLSFVAVHFGLLVIFKIFGA